LEISPSGRLWSGESTAGHGIFPRIFLQCGTSVRRNNTLVFFLIVYMYFIQVLTKFHCPKMKTFVLAEFLGAESKMEKFSEVSEEPHEIPADEAAGHH
jgi:hypothetical protein